MSNATRIGLWTVGIILFPPLGFVPLYRWWKRSQQYQREPFRAGMRLHDAGQYDEATASFQQVPVGDERYVKAQLLVADGFLRRADYQTAAEVLKRVTSRQQPTNDEQKEGRYWLGRCYQELGQRSAAEQEFRKVYSVDSRYRDVAQRLRNVTA